MVNYLAVLVCGAAAIALGSVWYSPAMFGGLWMKEMKVAPADIEAMKKKGMTGMWKAYVLQLVASLVTAYVLGNMISYNGLTDVPTALIFAFFVWLGFIATTTISFVTWEGKSWTYWAIVNGFNVVSLGISAAILVSWK